MIVVALLLGGSVLAALAAVVWAASWFELRDWLWLALISALFTAAVFGRTLLREVVGFYRCHQSVRSFTRMDKRERTLFMRSLAEALADSGTLTNSKPLCPHGRNKLNRTRS